MRRYAKRKNKTDYIVVFVSIIIIIISIFLTVFFISNYNNNKYINNNLLNEISGEVVSYERDYSNLKEDYDKSYSELEELSSEINSLKKIIYRGKGNEENKIYMCFYRSIIIDRMHIDFCRYICKNK